MAPLDIAGSFYVATCVDHRQVIGSATTRGHELQMAAGVSQAQAASGPKCRSGRDMITAHDGLSIDGAGAGAVAMEVVARLMFLGVPAHESDECKSHH